MSRIYMTSVLTRWASEERTPSRQLTIPIGFVSSPFCTHKDRIDASFCWMEDARETDADNFRSTADPRHGRFERRRCIFSSSTTHSGGTPVVSALYSACAELHQRRSSRQDLCFRRPENRSGQIASPSFRFGQLDGLCCLIG